MVRPATRRGEGPARGDSWPQRLHERDEGVDFRGREVLAVGRHVPATLQDLTDELIARLTRRDAVERRTTSSAFTGQAMARPALLVLEDEGALELERRPTLDVLDRRGGGAPGCHVR